MHSFLFSFHLGDYMNFVMFNGRKIEYEIIRKNVKNINLRVRRDASVAVSANHYVPESVIEEFVLQNAEKIIGAQDKNAARNTESALANGSKIMLLGEEFDLIIKESNRQSYYINEKDIVFRVSDLKDTEQIKSVYLCLLRNTAEVVFPKLLKECYPAFESVCSELPVLKIKDLKSQWGNCYYKRNLITLNLRLAVYDMHVIRSVIYHEYCHFVHQNHSKEFYNLLSRVYPNWKQCSRILKGKP